MLATLEGLSGPALVKVFNAVTGQGVTRFTSRQSGVERVQKALAGTNTDLGEAMAMAGIQAENGSAAAEPVDPMIEHCANLQAMADSEDEVAFDIDFVDEAGLAMSAADDADGPQSRYRRDRYGFIRSKHGTVRKSGATTKGGGGAAGAESGDGGGDDAPKKAKRARRGPAKASDGAPRGPSRLDTVTGLLRRKGGATVAEIQEATGWLPHTTRAYLSKGGAPAKAGIKVTSEKVERGASKVTVYTAE